MYIHMYLCMERLYLHCLTMLQLYKWTFAITNLYLAISKIKRKLTPTHFFTSKLLGTKCWKLFTFMLNIFDKSLLNVETIYCDTLPWSNKTNAHKKKLFNCNFKILVVKLNTFLLIWTKICHHAYHINNLLAYVQPSKLKVQNAKLNLM